MKSLITAIIVAAGVIAASLLFVFRWEVTAVSLPGSLAVYSPVALRIDRWTGDITVCHGRGIVDVISGGLANLQCGQPAAALAPQEASKTPGRILSDEEVFGKPQPTLPAPPSGFMTDEQFLGPGYTKKQPTVR
jgi:hypothetical protein